MKEHFYIVICVTVVSFLCSKRNCQKSVPYISDGMLVSIVWRLHGYQ